MSVPSSKALQEQLSAVLEALTKAALAEISALVEEGYAVLRLEIRRSRQENQDLRKKLHLIESIVVPAGGGGENRAEEAEAEATGAAGRPETPRRPRDPERDGGDGGSAGVEPEEVPDVVLIKDEDSDGFDGINDERSRHDAGAAAVSSARSVRRRRRRSRPYEDGDLKSSRLSVGPQQNVPVYSLDSPCSDPGGSAPDAPSCSYPDVQLVQDGPLAPPGPSRQLFFSSAALLEAQSPSGRAAPDPDLDLDLDPSWSKQAKGPMSFAQFCPGENLEGDVFSLKLVGVGGPTDDAGAAFEFENDGAAGGGGMLDFGLYGSSPGRRLSGADPDEDAHRKRFVCSVCNKTYATAQNLEVHNRIHTGERPFACDQCGKKFTQSAHLRSHLNVHTGERPYGCSLCSRSFIVRHSLKLHIRKCHPNSWAQTGPTAGPKRPQPGPNWAQQLSPNGPNN